MQKNLIIFLLLFARPLLVLAEDKQPYTIIGTLPDSIDNVYVHLTPVESAESDSALVRKGQFRFDGVAGTEKEVYGISIAEYPECNGMVFVEPGTILYHYRHLGLMTVQGYGYAKGTPLNDWYTDSITTPMMQLNKLEKLFENGKIDETDPEVAKIMAETQQQARSASANLYSFILANNTNKAGEYVFLSYCYMLQGPQKDKMLAGFPESVRQKYHDRMKPANPDFGKTAVGQPYIPFRGKTLTGDDFALADIVGKKKMILLDFWASWCAPCIKEIPTLTQLYEQYKDKGLEIVGISSDLSEVPWKKAIQKHNMPWTQVIDNPKKSSENITMLYGVQAIPHMVLIDEKGTIVAVNLLGQKLIDWVKGALE